jgi:hypothetical protein
MAQILLKTKCSGHLEAMEGSLFNLTRTFSTPGTEELNYTKITHPPTAIVLAPLVADQKVSLCQLTTIGMLFIESDFPVTIRIGSATNTPIPVRSFLIMTTDFVNDPDPLSTTGLFISNPSATDPATVTITAVGN